MQHLPSALVGAHLPLLWNCAVDGFAGQGFQIFHLKVWPDLAESPPNISGQQVQQFLRGRSEAANAQIVAHHDHGNIDVAQQVKQIVVGRAQLRVAVLHFLVQGSEFLIRGLQLFLGRLQFFVGALQFFVGR